MGESINMWMYDISECMEAGDAVELAEQRGTRYDQILPRSKVMLYLDVKGAFGKWQIGRNAR